MKKSPFSIKGAILEGWELTKLNIGFLVTYQILLFFFIWLFSDLPSFSLINIIGILIISLGKMGFINSILLLTKGLKPTFHQFYSNWRHLLTWIISFLIFGLIISFGLILLIIPGLYLWAVFGLFPFFILDKHVGPIEALKRSANATVGIRWYVFLLLLATSGIMLLGLLFFGIGILIAAPVATIALATVYRKLTGQSQTSIQPSDIF